MTPAASVVLSLLAGSAYVLAQQGATYTQSLNVVGSDILTVFTFENETDPTGGFVTYVAQDYAVSSGMLTYTDTTFTLAADSTETLNPSGTGRNSFRIKSTSTYGTHVAVFNVNHMPEGCGTWPAIWETLESDWPNGGEMDIVEGVNNVEPNQSTLHTGPGCTMPTGPTETGNQVSTDCNANDNGNQGCGVDSSDDNSYGPDFNSAGGGWYAMERTDSYLQVWFWERSATNVPSDVTTVGQTVDTSNWGTPTAYFPNTDCSVMSSFADWNIIINLTFCGAWAGQASVYAASGCPSTCIDYVAENPSAFSNAYFEFTSITVYE